MQGSAELRRYFKEDDIISTGKSVPPPFRIRVKNWFKNNAMLALIVPIVLGILGWGLSNLINLNTTVAKLEIRCDNLEKVIEKLDNYVEKEDLSKELELLSLKIDKATSLNIGELEKRVEVLERYVFYSAN